jgi:TetR/AcrR family transcriptional regulator, transcriptional repressor of bet genes
MNRRRFHRAPEWERRQELLEATLDCIAEQGLQGATVRQIAVRAGVTAGLIRHYFESKDMLVAAAYRQLVTTFAVRAVSIEGDPRARLREFMVRNLTAPISNSRSLSLWAAFISQVNVDPGLGAIHREGYLGFLDDIQQLLGDFLATEGRTVDAPERRRLAIAINAVIDGLWLEGCLAGDLFHEAELVGIALNTTEAILGLPLGDPEDTEE